MIVQCENCRARFNLSEKFIKPTGTAVRCSKCLTVFRILPPESLNESQSSEPRTAGRLAAATPANMSRQQAPTVELSGSTAVISLPMDALDINNSQEVTRHIEPVLADNLTVVFDLSAVKFVDSSGCGVMLQGLQTMKAKNGRFLICCASPQVRATFRLMRLDRLVDISDSKAEALELTAN